MLTVLSPLRSHFLAGGGVVAGLTVMVTDLLTLPPLPVHARVYVLVPVLVSAPVLWEPPVDFVPLQEPEAVQAVALVVLQVSVLLLPTVMVVGLAVKVRVGAAGGAVLMVTVAVPLALAPTLLTQVSVKLWVPLASAPVVALVPLVALEPVQLALVGEAEAVQDVALVVLQVSALVLPVLPVVGLAVMVTVGVGGMVTVAERLMLPPLPVQVRV